MLSTVAALEDGRLSDRWSGLIVAVGIALVAFGLRIINLGFPHEIMFDETYYAKDAWTIWLSGFERDWVEGDSTNQAILQGNWESVISDQPSYVVHPPLGKLLIGLGEQWFGFTPFGWRFMAAVFGSIMVFLVVRLARRLSRSTLVGGIAGVLLTFDGLAFVMSRIALLDIFQATFAVAGIAALVADRDWFRRKLAGYLRARGLDDLGGSFGPWLWWRPWRIVAGVMFGLSCAVKWNTVFMMAVFGIVTVAWDLGARHLAGAGRSRWFSLLIDAPVAFVQLIVVAIPVYIGAWFRWLQTQGGYYRNWGIENPDDAVVKIFGAPLGALWHYHAQMYSFHTGEGMKAATHPYEAHPAGWLLMIRPIGISAENDIQPGDQGCRAVGTTCLRVVSAMGTPVLWWMAAAALVAAAWWWLGKRDWRFAVPLLAVLSVWLPWFRYAERPLFFFYAIMIIPFSCIALAMALGKLLGPADGPRRRWRATVVSLAVALVILNFAFIYPILTADLLTRAEWLMRMWLGNLWI